MLCRNVATGDHADFPACPDGWVPVVAQFAVKVEEKRRRCVWCIVLGLFLVSRLN